MITRTGVRHISFLMILAVLANISWAASQKKVASPPNAPATVDWNAGQGRLILRYHGTGILDAKIGAQDADGRKVEGVAIKLEQAETVDDKVEQRLKFVPAKPQEG